MDWSDFLLEKALKLFDEIRERLDIYRQRIYILFVVM